MQPDTKTQVKVILGLFGMTGVLVVIGVVTDFINQISGKLNLG